MNDAIPPGMPEIDTEDFELELSPDDELEEFKRKRTEFLNLIYDLIRELKLEGKIEILKICSPAKQRNEIYREPKNSWPSKKICIDICHKKYMNKALLSHELGHEADRHDPSMQYDQDIESRCKNQWEFEMAANISLDARLEKRKLGLGKSYRWKEFHQCFPEQKKIFDDYWATPPDTWSKIKKFANKLKKIKP
jgi:hypothetical protein